MPAKPNGPAKSAGEPSESLLSRTLLAPILFISFLLSLLLIDGRTSTAILQSHPEQHGRDRDHGRAGEPGGVAGRKYYRSNQRHLAKLELDDAFAYQKRVIAAMCVASAIFVVGLAWVVMKAWEREWTWEGWAWGLRTGQGEKV